MAMTVVRMPSEAVDDMTPDRRLDFYAAMLFDNLRSFREFGALPVEQQPHVLQDVIDDLAATGIDGIGGFTRAQPTLVTRSSKGEDDDDQ